MIIRFGKSKDNIVRLGADLDTKYRYFFNTDTGEIMKETNRDITPLILAAIAVLKKVDGVEDVELLSTEMYRTSVNEECPIGCLGVDIKVNDVKTFLRYGMCEDLIMYPLGGFLAIDFIQMLLNDDDPETFFKDKE